MQMTLQLVDSSGSMKTVSMRERERLDTRELIEVEDDMDIDKMHIVAFSKEGRKKRQKHWLKRKTKEMDSVDNSN